MATELTRATVVGPVETPAGLKPTSGRVQWRLPAPDGEGSTVVGPVVEEAVLDAEGQFSKMLWCPTEGARGLSYAVSLTWWDDVTGVMRTVSLGFMTLAYSSAPQALMDLLVPEMPAILPTDILAAAAAYAAAAEAALDTIVGKRSLGLLAYARPDFGGIGTPPFAGGDRAPQGVTQVRIDGDLFLAYLQRTGGNDYQSTERHRICMQALPDSFASSAIDAYSAELALGHQGLSAVVEDGVTWFYTTMTNPNPTDVQNAGKGFARVHWRGSATAQADVENFQVFGDQASGHRYAAYYGATVCVSQSGKYLVMLASDTEAPPSEDIDNTQDSRRTMFVYDRAALLAAATPSSVNPIHQQALRADIKAENQGYVQGLACDDRFVYVQRGYVGPRQNNIVQVFDFYGNIVHQFGVDGPRARYSMDQLRGGGDFGVPESFEPQGLALRADGTLLYLAVDIWRAVGSVVEFEGKRFACIKATSSISPRNQLYWTEAGKVVGTFPAWESGIAYAPGARTRNDKTVFALVKEANAEYPLTSEKAYQPSDAQMQSYGPWDMTWPPTQFLRGGIHSESTGKYTTVYEWSEGALRMFDAAIGADPAKFFQINRNFVDGREQTQFRALAGLAANGAWMDFHGLSDPVRPGVLVLSGAGSDNRMELRPGIGPVVDGVAGRGDVFGAMPLPPIAADADWVAGLKYLVLGDFDSNDFALSGTIRGGRPDSVSTAGRLAVVEISTSRGSGGVRHTLHRILGASSAADGIALRKVTVGGVAKLAFHVTGPSVPLLREGIFEGVAKGFAPVWVNESAVTAPVDVNDTDGWVVQSGVNRFLSPVELPGGIANGAPGVEKLHATITNQTLTGAAALTVTVGTIPANCIGANGIARIYVNFGMTNSVNDKTVTVKVGAVTVFSATGNTLDTATGYANEVIIFADGTTDWSRSITAANPFGNTTAVGTTNVSGIDWTVANIVTVDLGLATTTETLTLISAALRTTRLN